MAPYSGSRARLHERPIFLFSPIPLFLFFFTPSSTLTRLYTLRGIPLTSSSETRAQTLIPHVRASASATTRQASLHSSSFGNADVKMPNESGSDSERGPRRERRPSTSAPISDLTGPVGPPGLSRPKHKRTLTGFGAAEIKHIEGMLPASQLHSTMVAIARSTCLDNYF